MRESGRGHHGYVCDEDSWGQSEDGWVGVKVRKIYLALIPNTLPSSYSLARCEESLRCSALHTTCHEAKDNSSFHHSTPLSLLIHTFHSMHSPSRCKVSPGVFCLSPHLSPHNRPKTHTYTHTLSTLKVCQNIRVSLQSTTHRLTTLVRKKRSHGTRKKRSRHSRAPNSSVNFGSQLSGFTTSLSW